MESWPIKYIFLYPDFNAVTMPTEPRGQGAYWLNSSTSFINYIIANGLFDKLYPTEAELAYFEFWFSEYRPQFMNNGFGVRALLDRSSLSRLEKTIRSRRTPNKNFDDLYLLLGKAYEKENPDSAAYYYKQADPTHAANICRENGGFGIYLTASAVSHLAGINEFKEAYRFIDVFKNPVNRSSLYGFAAQQLLKAGKNPAGPNQLIDSARAEMLRVKTGVENPSRLQVPYALAMRAGENDLTEADRVIKNVGIKFFVQHRLTRSVAFHGNLFEAYKRIPLNVSATDKTVFLWHLLNGYAEGNHNANNEWLTYNNNHRFWYSRGIWYQDENN
jgi:hypothetical protein